MRSRGENGRGVVPYNAVGKAVCKELGRRLQAEGRRKAAVCDGGGKRRMLRERTRFAGAWKAERAVPARSLSRSCAQRRGVSLFDGKSASPARVAQDKGDEFR